MQGSLVLSRPLQGETTGSIETMQLLPAGTEVIACQNSLWTVQAARMRMQRRTPIVARRAMPVQTVHRLAFAPATEVRETSHPACRSPICCC